jgi:hypothetical protein
MKILKLTTLIAAIAIMYSCNKHNDEKVVSLDGNYSGYYTQYTALTGNAATTNIAVKLASFDYSTYSSLQSNVPSAKGSYKINTNQVNFTDTLIFPGNINGAVFLSGIYSFKVTADSLTLIRVVNDYSIVYKLKRQ